MATCENCRFFRHGSEGGFGECRRRPPVLLSHALGKKHDTFEEEMFFRTAFPVLADTDWCGEWAPGEFPT